jgi:hypothetical protein
MHIFKDDNPPGRFQGWKGQGLFQLSNLIDFDHGAVGFNHQKVGMVAGVEFSA